MSDSDIVSFGKFAGQTYGQMYRKKWYVKWVYEQSAVNGALKELKDYFESKDYGYDDYIAYRKCPAPQKRAQIPVKPMFVTPATSPTRP